MPVAERFVSVNGEGLRAGMLSAFVRFAGCGLACSYCDTAWAREADAAAERLTIAEIADWACAQPATCVTLTGGEPLEQPLLAPLVGELLGRRGSRPRTIEVETNGACSIAELAAAREAAGGDSWNGLSITLDCKMPSSGMDSRMDARNFELVDARDAVKFVCGDRADLDAARAAIERHGLSLRTNVLLSPVAGALAPAAIVDYLKETALVDVRLQLQLHKIIWPGEERGV